MIVELTEVKEREWDEYVLAHDCSYYFKIAWRDVVHDNFKHSFKYYISINNNGQIDGILPLFIVKSFFAIKLISIPYCPYGGVVANNEEIKDLLITKAIELGYAMKAKYIELKDEVNDYPNFVNVSNYFTFRLNLDIALNDIWKSFSKSNKRKIKKNENIDFKVKIDSDIDVFYKLYLLHMKMKGTPAIKYEFFDDITKKDKNNVKVASLWFKGELASAILLLETPTGIIYDRGASNVSLSSLNLNYTLFWELIKYYHGLNMKFFDFGRSVEESGTFQFKRSWRPNVIKLNYSYFLYKGSLPQYSQSSLKRKLLSKFLKITPRVVWFENYLRKIFP